ncbi:hypothetical protein AK812_SmicGene13485 [Symbiodinium microadriaticum]|uniref:Uncharacterized protein n=1 Tax=Symbiodinium microadriaticum TaxID=2951 RepID=A0A1Q9E817_SYMMI|nr:hypothetical protein AK812_SmicGene13485 [Symbiodinium microadriaticum]
MHALDADFDQAAPVVLLLVCQGLESQACAALRAFARARLILEVLPAGGVDGEASVGKILASVPPGTGEWVPL